jgi:hypothetical protein
LQIESGRRRGDKGVTPPAGERGLKLARRFKHYRQSSSPRRRCADGFQQRLFSGAQAPNHALGYEPARAGHMPSPNGASWLRIVKEPGLTSGIRAFVVGRPMTRRIQRRSIRMTAPASTAPISKGIQIRTAPTSASSKRATSTPNMRKIRAMPTGPSGPT